MAILDGLTRGQKEAVLCTTGPLLVIAGAGSGKTKTIAHRIVQLMAHGVPPERILAVTFTNKAAVEMQNRIHGLARREGMSVHMHDMFVGTFHALGASILREHGRPLGIPKHYSILDEDDSRAIIKNLIREFQLDPEAYSPVRVHNAISRHKNELESPADLAQNSNNPYEKNMHALYAAYEARLARTKNLDFDDLLQKTVVLLKTSDDTRKFYESKWSHIHIDEYQDTNNAQYALSLILARKHKNIAVVGDVDQAIYSWRGADWRNILQFEEDWPGARVITLEDNFRSTPVILEAANAVIINNKMRKEKNLVAQKNGGAAIDIKILADEAEEGLAITEYVGKLTRDGVKPNAIAVLFRTNAQARAIEEAFLKRNIPYRLIAGVKFYERKEIKDLLSYLKFALNPDDIISKKRIINTPSRGIGKVTLLRHLSGKTLSAKEAAKIDKFNGIIGLIRKAVYSKKASAALEYAIKTAGFEKYYKGNAIEEDRLANIKELLSVARKFNSEKPPEGIAKLLTEASLMTQNENAADDGTAVVLLTAHSAKGLEFDAVIIAGAEEGLFPHSLSEADSELEEERRLFYVALTRARDKIIITLARHRLIYGDITYNDPSRFIKEIPGHLTESAGAKRNLKDGFYEEDEIKI